jgi:hypothetical protein
VTHDQARAGIQERFGVAAEGDGALLTVSVPPERWSELAGFAKGSRWWPAWRISTWGSP